MSQLRVIVTRREGSLWLVRRVELEVDGARVAIPSRSIISRDGVDEMRTLTLEILVKPGQVEYVEEIEPAPTYAASPPVAPSA